MNAFFRSVAVGVGAATTLGVLAFALAPFFDAVGVYIAPFGLLTPMGCSTGRLNETSTGFID